jgi:hypothetical protein
MNITTPTEGDVFLVEVTQGWLATTQVLVRAPSPAIARDVARAQISFSSFDAESDGKSCTLLKELGPQELDDLRQENELGSSGAIEDTAYVAYRVEFPMKLNDGTTKTGGQWRGREVGLDELVDLVATPEAIEAARLARIEASNGQIALPLQEEVTCSP